MTSTVVVYLIPGSSNITNSRRLLAQASFADRMLKFGLADSPSDREVHSTGSTNFVAAAPRLNIVATKIGFIVLSFGDVHCIGAANSGG